MNIRETFPATSWTDERVTQLKALWADGVTARLIAKAMGGISRSGVLGKVHRLNLSGRSRNPHPRKQPPMVETRPPLNEGRTRPPRPRRSQPPAGTTMQRTIIRPARAGGCRAIDTVAVVLTDLPPDQSPFLCTIADLTDVMCRFPIGDPGKPTFGYCGDVAPEGEGHPYCTRHHRLAHKANPYRGTWK